MPIKVKHLDENKIEVTRVKSKTFKNIYNIEDLERERASHKSKLKMIEEILREVNKTKKNANSKT